MTNSKPAARKPVRHEPVRINDESWFYWNRACVEVVRWDTYNNLRHATATRIPWAKLIAAYKESRKIKPRRAKVPVEPVRGKRGRP